MHQINYGIVDSGALYWNKFVNCTDLENQVSITGFTYVDFSNISYLKCLIEIEFYEASILPFLWLLFEVSD